MKNKIDGRGVLSLDGVFKKLIKKKEDFEEFKLDKIQGKKIEKSQALIDIEKSLEQWL